MEFFEQLKAKCPCRKRDAESVVERREHRRERRRTVAGAIVEHERRKIRRRRFRKYVWPVLRNILILLTGACAGIHRHVIIAAIKGEPLPESPHRWCR